MADINFNIPFNNEELLQNDLEKYSVKDVIGVKEIVIKLKDARAEFKEQGPEYVLEHFDTYFSILYHSEKIRLDVVMQAWEDLQRACEQLNNTVAFLLEDSENLSDDIKVKYLNVIKMLVYLFTKTVLLIEQKCTIKNKTMKYSDDDASKGRGRKSSEDSFNIKDKNKIILLLNNLIQRNLNNFWDPPVAEENFVNCIAEVCYRFLENPFCKSEKEHQENIFHVLGKLIKSYNHVMSFTIRIAQIIKLHAHVVSIVSYGIKILVEQYQCKGLVRHFIRELTEWQTEEKYQDTQGTKHCCNVLTELSVLMPDLMTPEMMYLMTYLNYESHTLRIAVLNIITEMILKVFTGKDLTEEQIEYRDDFLDTLEDYTADMVALVRGRVFQNWAKLQQENAIPIKKQFTVLEKAIFHLRDKAAAVRKNAAHLLTTFIQCNIYAATLNLSELDNELEAEMKKYTILTAEVESSVAEKVKQTQERWTGKEKDIKKVVTTNLTNSITEEEESEEADLDVENLDELLKTYIDVGQYQDAFIMCKKFQKKFMENEKEEFNQMNQEQQVNFYMQLLQKMYITPSGAPSNDGPPKQESYCTQEQLKNLEAVQRNIDYLKDATKFISLIESAIPPMKQLITSTTVGDMHEAVNFFVVAYQFSINGAIEGILHMLLQMRSNEQDRRTMVVDAYKKIYLQTDAKTAEDHTSIIIQRLSDLIRSVTYEFYNDLSLIVAEWVSRAMLDNLVINALWQVFTKSIPNTTIEQCRIATKLLAMAARGKKSIISRNINLVVSQTFGEDGRNDLKLFEEACRFISLAATEKIDESDENPCFRIDTEEEIWQKLMDVLVDTFPKKNFYWNNAVSAAVVLIFKLCRKPEKISKILIERILKVVQEETKDGEISDCLLKQVVHLVGEVAIQEFIFLDMFVYKEMKRRNNIREEKKNTKAKNDKKRKSVVNRKAAASSRVHIDVTNSSFSATEITEETENELEGAVAEDLEAEFILRVCENDLVTSNLLGKFGPMLVKICQELHVYQGEAMQTTAVLALLRFMTISSMFCEQNLQLIFTLLEKSEYATVKQNITLSMVDLLSRFPNSIEPWTPRIYAKLRDGTYLVRRTTFLVLSRLIYCDMMRIKGHIAEMGLCLVEPEKELQDMSKHFFTSMSKKGNNLYNVIPDIISRLTDPALQIEEKDYRTIMRFILSQIEKDKQIESLVERLCIRFKLVENDRQCCDIAFCLSMLQYNEKALVKLMDSLDLYKEKLHIEEVYRTLKGIINTCGKSPKAELKRLAIELETKIEAVFDIDSENKNPNNDDNLMPPPKRPVLKKPVSRGRKKKTKSVDDDDDEDEFNDNAKSKANVSLSGRPQRSRRKAASYAKMSDSDSD